MREEKKLKLKKRKGIFSEEKQLSIVSFQISMKIKDLETPIRLRAIKITENFYQAQELDYNLKNDVTYYIKARMRTTILDENFCCSVLIFPFQIGQIIYKVSNICISLLKIQKKSLIQNTIL